ncbi:MAG: hypothetical protein KGL19_02855 [Bacteroidota bacterium]|nr:hypothetical protein [Bacteroidota bacterium]
MRKLLFFLFLFSSQIVFSQDNYEIQVYGAETQAKGTSIFELHSNYTFNGEKNMIDGVIPSNHALHETIEITQGITDNFEIGFYLFTNYTSEYGYKVIGSHIRPRIAAPEKWKLPVGLSMSAEIGYQDQSYSPDTWSVELRPIIDKQWKKLYVSVNPTLGISLKGINQYAAPSFEPNIKAAYTFFKNANLGFEYYGSMGPINQFDKLPQQNHALFLAYDMLNNDNWELNIGPGFGLTNATDKFVFKVLAGRKIVWHKKSAR